MLFDYLEQTAYTKTIDIVDIGNTAIRATTDDNIEYYLVTKTVMGKTSILKFGPVVPDLPILLNNFDVTFQKIDYKEAAIGKQVNMLINNFKNKIVDVVEITEYEAFEALPNIVECFNEEGE